jgi:putative ABC transport system permease protein
LRTLLQDLRYAVRQLRKSPGFTLAAVLTLAIGIGANTATFSILDGLVLHPLTVPEMDKVLTVFSQNRGEEHHVALANYEDWQRQSRSFEDLAVHTSGDMSLTGAGDAAHVQTELASSNFFRVMRANALVGRVFDPGETQPGKDRVAVLSYVFWQQHFNSDVNVVGRKIELDQQSYTVIGVMPKSANYPSLADVFLPLAPTSAQLANRTARDYLVMGRLRKGVTADQARAELRIISDRLAQQYPATNQGWSVKMEPLIDGMWNGDQTPVYVKLIMAATLFVLLVVCANVANLQLARGLQRQPEIAMRTALGAGRWRLLRQLLTENILLGLIGAAGGLLFAQLYLHISIIAMPERIAHYMVGWSKISLNGRALGFSLLLAVGAGVISGLAPALAALRVNLAEQLKSGSRAIAGAGKTRWFRNVFAVAQISLAVALVIGAALMTKGVTALFHTGDRFNPSHVLIFDVHLPAARYDTPEKRAAWQNASLDKLRALPGVQYASLSTGLPLSYYGTEDCQIENRPLAPGKIQSALRMHVSDGYFAAFSIPLISGRLFNQGDGLRSPLVAVVSRGFVTRYFPGENPLGHRIRMGTGLELTPWLTIAGVVEEVDYSLLDQSHEAAVYINAAQIPPTTATYSIVTAGDPDALAPSARKALAQIDPTLPLDTVRSLANYLQEGLTGLMYVAAMLGVDGLIALLLAAIGIFAVMANQVGERTREIGVRLAMGARREDVLSMILRRAVWLTSAGVGIGLVLAFALAHGVANLLYGVQPDDPTIFSGITAVIVAIALMASWLPARRASRIDPMIALRDE